MLVLGRLRSVLFPRQTDGRLEPPRNPTADGRECMRLVRSIAAAALVSMLGLAPGWAQAPYPNRPIRVLVPYAPGGLTDVVARHYADQLRKSLGQNVLVENKP